MEERVQTFLCVVVAKVLKGRAVFTLHQPGVLEAWSVHNQQRAQGVLSRFQCSGAHRANTYVHANISTLLLEATLYGLNPLHLTLKFNLSYLQRFPNFNPQPRGDPANPPWWFNSHNPHLKTDFFSKICLKPLKSPLYCFFLVTRIPK